MGVRFPSVASNASFALPASAAETVIVTTPPLNIPLDFAQVFLHWFIAFVGGTAITAAVFRLRRGTTVAGALVGSPPYQSALNAGNTVFYSGSYFDTPGAVAGQQYSLTLVQLSATGAGTINDISLIAFAL